MSFQFRSSNNKAVVPPKSTNGNKQPQQRTKLVTTKSFLDPRIRPPSRKGGERQRNQPQQQPVSSLLSSAESNRQQRLSAMPTKKRPSSKDIVDDSNFCFLSNESSEDPVFASTALSQHVASTCEEVDQKSLSPRIPRKPKTVQGTDFGAFQRVSSPPLLPLPQHAQKVIRQVKSNSEVAHVPKQPFSEFAKSMTSATVTAAVPPFGSRTNKSQSSSSLPQSETIGSSHGFVGRVIASILSISSPNSKPTPLCTSAAATASRAERNSIVNLCDDSTESDNENFLSTQPPETPPAVVAVKQSSTSSSASSDGATVNNMMIDAAVKKSETITIPTTPPLTVSRKSLSLSSASPTRGAFTLHKASIKLSPLALAPKGKQQQQQQQQEVGQSSITKIAPVRGGDNQDVRTKSTPAWSTETQLSRAPDVSELTIDDTPSGDEGFISPPYQKGRNHAMPTPAARKLSLSSQKDSECIDVEAENPNSSPLLTTSTHFQSGLKNRSSNHHTSSDEEADLKRITETYGTEDAKVVELENYKISKIETSLKKPRMQFTKQKRTYGGPSLGLQYSRREKTIFSGNNSSVIGKRTKSKRIVPGNSLSKVESDLEVERTNNSNAITPTYAAHSGQSEYGFDPAARAKRTQSSGIDPSRFHSKRSKSVSPPNNRHASENPNDPLVDTEDEAETKRSSRKRRKSNDCDDEEWTSGEEKKQAKPDKLSKKITRRSTRVRSRDGSFGNSKKTNEPIEIDDSSEDEKPISQSKYRRPLVYDVARIAIGKKIFTNGCEIKLEPAKGRLELFVGKADLSISIDPETLLEMKFFLVEEEVAAANYAEEDEMSFLSMRVDPTRLTGLKSVSNAYCQDVSEPNVDERRKYIVVEFRSDKDFIELLDAMRETDLRTFATSDSKLSRFQMESYSKTLVEKNQKDKKCRMSSIGGSSKKDRHPFLANRKEKETLLVYPFPVTASEVFEAVKDLKELKGISGNDIESMDVSDDDECKVDDLDKATSTDEAENKASTTRGRAHYVTVLSDDYSRLDAPEFFNDTLIDFWMQWMRRGERESTVHIFTSHFYTTLAEEGVQAVESWTAKRGIDIFEKKFIFVPVNKSLHWSLCVVVNPGAIRNDPDDEEKECPCLIFLDSLKAHRKNEVALNIRKWLNSEWLRLNKGAKAEFSPKSMPVYDPRIPYQDNCWDCGVFVCRYAFAMYQLRQLTFSFGQIDKGRASFLTRSPEFQFDMSDIHRIREEVRTLLERLTALYKKWKDEEKRKHREAKLAAKAAAAAAAENSESEKGDAAEPTTAKDDETAQVDEHPDQKQEEETQQHPNIKIEPEDEAEPMDFFVHDEMEV